MTRQLLVVLPPTARRWGDWIVVDIPCYEAGQDKRDERKADGEKEGEALRGKKISTRCARQQNWHTALFYSCTSSTSSPSRVRHEGRPMWWARGQCGT